MDPKTFQSGYKGGTTSSKQNRQIKVKAGKITKTIKNNIEHSQSVEEDITENAPEEVTEYEHLAPKVKANKRMCEEQGKDHAVPRTPKRAKGSEENGKAGDLGQTKSGTQANFSEDDRIMTFDVEAEDCFSEEETEIGNDQIDSDEDEGLLSEQELNEDVMQVQAHSSNDLGPNEINLQETQMQEKISSVEEKMKQKLLELKHLMKEGGMENAFQQCFGVPEEGVQSQ